MFTRRPTTIAAAVLSAAVLLPASARAASVTSYTSESDFVAAIGANHAFDDFNDLGYGDIAGNATAPRPNATYGDATYSAGPHGLWSNTGAMSTNAADDALTVSFSSPDVTAAGGIFYVSDPSGNPITPYLITIHVLSGATELVNENVFVTSATSFYGYVSDTPITAIKLSFPATPNPSQYMTMDNVRYAAPAAAVPLPASALAAAPLLALTAAVRRRRQARA